MLRRLFLQSLAASALPFSSQLWAAPTSSTQNNKFLFVFLRGGYDAANLLVPTSSDFYYASRPNIAIPRPSQDNNSALALTQDWGLHPTLRDNIFLLYQNGEALFIPFSGTEDTSRSHFETQDNIELGQGAKSSRTNYRSGMLNRLVEVLYGNATNKLGAIAFTEQLPLIMQGKVQLANIALKNIGQANIDTRQGNIIESMYRGTSLAKQVDEGFSVRNDIQREMMQEKNAEMQAANRQAISTKGFELEVRRIAKLMQEKYSIGFIDVGGWDTHVGQGSSTGYLAGRLNELGRGLAGFSQAMGAAWKNTVVVVVSEFGRTFRENGNRGTDHGHGSVYWVLGGGIKGKQVVGEQVSIQQNMLFQNRDYPVLNEYRAVLGGILARTYDLSTKQLDYVFNGAKAKDLGII